MPIPYIVKDRDLPRFQSGEIVRTTLREWAQPLADELTHATGDEWVASESPYGGNGRSYLKDIFPELFFLNDGVYNFSCTYTISLNRNFVQSTDYTIDFCMRSNHTSPITKWEPRLRVANKGGYDIYKKTFSEDFLFFPFGSVSTFTPLAEHVLQPILINALKRGLIPPTENNLYHAGLLTPELKHTLRTLAGLKRKSEKMLGDTLC